MRSEFEKDPTAKELAKEFFDKPLIDRFYTNVGEYIFNHQQSKIDELQKRVDAVNGLIEDLNKCYQQDHQNKFEYWRGFADSAGILGKRLEQALKGGNE